MLCPTPGKIAYASLHAAHIARRLRSRGQRMRIYKCPCGRYHMTSLLVPVK